MKKYPPGLVEAIRALAISHEDEELFFYGGLVDRGNIIPKLIVEVIAYVIPLLEEYENNDA